MLLLLTCLITWKTAQDFRQQFHCEELVPSSYLTRTILLSHYESALSGTAGDTRIYIFRGDTNSGGKALIVGGTHPDEPAGFITTYLMIENLKVNKGTIFIIPRANNSAFTHTLPQEGMPQFFSIQGKHGTRIFRYGARITNAIDQWPDPEIYLHYPSGQKLAGNETRNLNRSYPGRIDGTLTELIAHGIIELINRERMDIAFDLHEASPEYPVVNAIVAPERSQEIATEAAMELEFEGLRYSLEASPYNFHGLSHREWADHTDCLPFLFETANPIQGRLRGKTDEQLLLSGRDKMYILGKDIGALTIPYDSTGLPLRIRVGRHLAALGRVIDIYSRYNPGRAIEYSGIPSYEVLEKNGLEEYF